jgi:hypothetical protein
MQKQLIRNQSSLDDRIILKKSFHLLNTIPIAYFLSIYEK